MSTTLGGVGDGDNTADASGGDDEDDEDGGDDEDDEDGGDDKDDVDGGHDDEIVEAESERGALPVDVRAEDVPAVVVPAVDVLAVDVLAPLLMLPLGRTACFLFCTLVTTTGKRDVVMKYLLCAPYLSDLCRRSST